jgi:hypothetical protein
MRLSRSPYRSVVRHHRLRVSVALTTLGADRVIRQTSARVTLVAPKGARL